MKNSQEILSSVFKTTQLNQTRIRSILDLGMQSSLRQELEAQLEGYHSIEMDVHTIANQRGWELYELDPTARFLIDIHARAKICGKNTDSLIAGMIIQRSTREMIRGFKYLHRLDHPDPEIQVISQRLLDQETHAIRQMENFL